MTVFQVSDDHEYVPTNNNNIDSWTSHVQWALDITYNSMSKARDTS